MAHIHEKVDFTVEVFIVHNNKILLRKHDKYRIWLSVGGHIELNEDPNEAAIREVKEEVGLDINLTGQHRPNLEKEDYRELLPPRFLNRHRINQDHEHITLVYFAKAKNDKIVLPKNEISDEIRWFTLDELNSPSFNIKESIKMYAMQALEELGS